MKRSIAISLTAVLALGLVIVASPPQPAVAQSTIYVDDDAPNDPGPGDPTVSDPDEDGSAAHPFDEIQEGIDDAWSGDTVQVASGTYNENIILKDGVQVLGASANVTTIDGSTARAGLPAYHVVVGAGNATLDGFTITGGNANGAGNDKKGGGMLNWSSSPTVTNCTFSSNSASWGGGGMYNDNSSPTVDNCTFSTNSATWVGGGMYNDNSSPTVTNCTFSGNWAYDGGGMANDNSSPSVTESTFSGNSATGGGTGGGMYNDNSSPTVSKCAFSSNSAGRGGGMYNRVNCSPQVTNCVFYNNSAGTWGGGMANSHGGSPMVTNSTFYNNSATSSGDGLYNYELSSLTVTNCILWGNGEEIFWSGPVGTSPTVTYSDVQGGYSGVGNIDADPIFVDPAGGDYHLEPGSPCIDSGTDTEAPTEDIEGNPRPIDGDGIPGAITDMGAYEYVPPVVGVEATVDFDPDTLNLKSNGKWVTCYIELPEDYDVEDVDVSTVELSYDQDSVPAAWGDVQDGALMVKFDRSDVQDVLDPGDEVELTVSGELEDGTLFEGTDTIRTIK